jgi:membrane protease YdiL (CAAX protease family)
VAWASAHGSAAQWAPPLAPPWGYGYPLPLAEPSPPSEQHPPASQRPLASLADRAAPQLYAAGWLLSLGGLAALVALIAAASAGLSNGIDRSVRLVAGETSLIALTVGLWAAAIAQSRQRRADGWEDYFGPSPLLATGLLVPLSAAVAMPLGQIMDRFDLEVASSVELLLALLINLACYATLTHWLGVRTGALTWSDVARPQHLAPTRQDLLSALWGAARPATSRLRRIAREIGLGAGLAVPAMIGTLFLAALVMSLLRLQDVPPSGDSYAIVTDFDFWIILVALAVVAPVGEEIFFRGLIANAWARSLARKQALLRATVLFASVHILNNELDPNALGLTLRLAAMAVVVRLPVSWLLCWAYTSQRSIIASMSLHGVYNGGLVLLTWWAWHQLY